jgi:hypothetical protein
MVLLTDLAESGSFIKVGLLQHPTLLLIPVLIAFVDSRTDKKITASRR